jgi:hypothetical protein
MYGLCDPCHARLRVGLAQVFAKLRSGMSDASGQAFRYYMAPTYLPTYRGYYLLACDAPGWLASPSLLTHVLYSPPADPCPRGSSLCGDATEACACACACVFACMHAC